MALKEDETADGGQVLTGDSVACVLGFIPIGIVDEAGIGGSGVGKVVGFDLLLE